MKTLKIIFTLFLLYMLSVSLIISSAGAKEITAREFAFIANMCSDQLTDQALLDCVNNHQKN